VVRFPVELAVARSSVELPAGSYAFEPKYDGWRLCAHSDRSRAWARLHTRAGTDVTSRFPEIVDSVAGLGEVVLDGEVVAAVGVPPRLEFAALQTRPQRRAAQGIGVYLLAFDILAADGTDLRSLPYPQRRIVLDEVLDRHSVSRVQLVPSTQDRAQAQEWLDPSFAGAGIEGVVAKPLSGPYRRGQASGWIKTRHLITTEAVIGGIAGSRQRPHALVLAAHQPGTGDRWRLVGVTSPITTALQAELAPQLAFAGRAPARLPGIVTGLPGSDDREYWPVRPNLVVEVATDGVAEHGRWRHPVRALRLRHDLAPADLATV
jgi:ATP-dependent DNA ligase